MQKNYRFSLLAISPVLAVSLLLLTGCASSRRDFDPKHDGRFSRLALTFPITPFVYSWMGYHILTEERGPHEVNFAEAARYDPQGLPDTNELDSATRELLGRWAPIIIQQVDPAAIYSASIDQVGSPVPMKTLGNEKYVFVDTDQPSLYAFTTQAEIQGQEHAQLNYVYWFPEHPSMTGGFDPEAGPVEGITLRITLDSQSKPLFYETVFNCGCYHRAFPTEEVDRKAAEEFGGPLKGKYTSVAKPVRFKIDFYSPESVRVPEGGRPVIFSAAGNHQPLHIGAESEIDELVKKLRTTHPMQLRDYAELTRGGVDGLGIFGPDKLVVGADRAEAMMLIPTGLYHAGTPRRRGAQLIHFDQYDFDDPRLLEKHLRIPKDL